MKFGMIISLPKILKNGQINSKIEVCTTKDPFLSLNIKG